MLARVLTLSALRQQWGAVVPLVAVLGLQRRLPRPFGLVAVLAAVVVVAAVGAVVEWFRTAYAVDAGRLVVERGLLSRSLTVVPIDRIRGVDVHASALQRLLGIASVRVDAAATGGKRGRGGAGRGQRGEDARELRDVLLRQAGRRARAGGAPGPAGRPRRPGAGPARPGAGEPAGEVLARFRPRWLLYAPLVGGYLLAPLAAVGAAAQLPATSGCRCRCSGGPTTRSAPGRAPG